MSIPVVHRRSGICLCCAALPQCRLVVPCPFFPCHRQYKQGIAPTRLLATPGIPDNAVFRCKTYQRFAAGVLARRVLRSVPLSVAFVLFDAEEGLAAK
jgi:hypothetical protein